MNATFPAIVNDFWSLAGWTMVHFLWLGAIVAAFAFAGRMLLRNAASNVRYTFVLLCLAVITAMPLAAAWLYEPTSLGRAQLTAEPSPSGRGQGEGALASGWQPAGVDPIAAPPIIELHTPSSDVAATVAPTNSPPLKGGAGGGIPNNASRPLANNAQPSTVVPSLLAARASFLTTLIPYLPWLWLIGTPLTFALLFTGLLGTHRLSRASMPITDGPIAEALARLAISLRITRRVTVAVCERVAAPVLIGIVRPMILLPPAALTGWSPDEIEMVLLHELAHIRRYDNVVNLAQRIIESLLFFHPAVWLISNWVRREREACCDAAVVARTQQPHAYATLLVNLAAGKRGRESFSREVDGDGVWEGEKDSRPLLLVPMAAGPLRTRIRHILQLEDDPMLVTPKSLAITLATLLAAATLAFVYLPKIGQAEQPTTEGTERSPAKAQQDTSDSQKPPTSAQYPVAVQFEQGASRFLDGDKISVLDVHGPTKTFEPGNSYWIKGTYTLQSRDEAQLSAFTTAKDSADATSPIRESQTTHVKRGSGTFELELPQIPRGWPHVSFYAAGGGDGFGGTYFGTGDSVLKQWQGSSSITDIERFRRIEKEIRTIDIVVVLFNNQEANVSSGLNKAYEQLIKRNRSLYVYGAKLDPTSPEAKRYSLKDSPTCIVFIHGKEAGRLDTIRSGDQLQEFVRTTISQAERSTTEGTENTEKAKGTDAKSLKESADKAVALEGNDSDASEKMESGPGARLDWYGKPVGPDSTRDWLGNRIAKNEPAADDPKLIRSLFQTGETNPIETRGYDVSSDLRRRLSSEFEGWQFDPYGPQVSFDIAWGNGDKRLTVRAPKAAHDKLFQPEIKRLTAQLASESAEQRTTKGTKNTKKEQESGADAADDWPKGVAFPSPKEGNISIAAWRQLHIKVVPASEGERTAEGGHAIKVVGGVATNPDVKKPLFLLSLNNHETKNFDELAAALEKVKGQALIVAKCVTTGSHGPVWIETALDGSDKPTQLVRVEPRLPPTPAAAGKPSSKFPTLEDQKLADLAWKRLRLELEPIAADDLQRVKALGYDGGVKVAAGSAGVSEGGGFSGNPSPRIILPNDILVGLHVWPTTSLKDIATVLNRDDLAELNPLKFYVVRRIPKQFGGGASDPGKDTVVSGRINVQLAAGFGAGGDRSSEIAEPKLVVSEETLHSMLAANPADIEKRVNFRVSVKDGGRVVVQGDALLLFYNDDRPQSQELRKTISSLKNEFQFFVADVDARINPEIAQAADVKSFPTLALMKGGKKMAQIVGEITADKARAMVREHFAVVSSPLAPRASQLAPRTSLRYDGKPFEEWRDVWKTELSTEKRIEAVKALAAFGRAGYGQEATAAILDVAGEYDFMIMQGGNAPEGKLQHAILEELAASARSQTLVPYWVPDLAARLQKDAKKWKWLAAQLLMQLRIEDEPTLKIVRDWESSGDNAVRAAALGALVRAGRTGDHGSQLDENTRKLIDKNLESKDPEMVRAALSYLAYDLPSGGGMALKPQLVYQPALLPNLVFHSDEYVRRQARSLLPLLDDKATTDLVDQLIGVLKDPSRQGDQIEAVRALGTLGKKATKANSALVDILKSSDDQPMLAATMVALARFAGRAFGNADARSLDPLTLNSLLGARLTADESRALMKKIGGDDDAMLRRFVERIQQEEQQIRPSRTTNLSGGGVF